MKNNPFDLYEESEMKRMRINATEAIKKAVKKRNWAEVERIQRKFRKVGADDTVSRDAILLYWKRIHGKFPRGWGQI